MSTLKIFKIYINSKEKNVVVEKLQSQFIEYLLNFIAHIYLFQRTVIDNY